jgi:hypothetical protein
MQNLDQRLVGLADLGLGPAVAGLQDLDRAAFRGRQLAARAVGTAARVARGVLAQHLVRVLDAEPRPGLFLDRFAEGFRRPVPDPVAVQLRFHLGLGGAFEEVPLEVVLAYMLPAEPVKILEVVGDFGARYWPGSSQPGASQIRCDVSKAPDMPRRPERRFFLSVETRRSKLNGSLSVMVPALLDSEEAV